MTTHHRECDSARHDICDALGYAILVLIVLIVPTAFSAWTYESGYIKRFLFELLVVAGAALWLARILTTQEVIPGSPHLTGATLWYWAIAGGSALLSGFPTISARSWWHVSTFVLFFLLIVAFIRTRSRVQGLLTSACISATLVACYGLAQWLGLDPFRWGGGARDRIVASIGNSTMLGTYLVAMLPIAVVQVWSGQTAWRKGLAAITGLACIACLLVSQAKSAWLAAVVAAIVLLVATLGAGLVSRNELRSRRGLASLGAGVLLVVIIGIFLPSVFERFRSTARDSARVRLVLWKAGVDIFRDYPLFGSGFGTFQVYLPRYRSPHFREIGLEYNTVHAHSEYLQVLAEQGLVGVAACTVLIVSIVAVALKTLKRAKTRSDAWIMCGLLGSVAGVLADAAASVSLRWYVCPVFFWLAVGLIAAMANVAADNTRSSGFGFRLRPVSMGAVAVATGAVLFLLGYTLTVKPFLGELCLRQGTRHMGRSQWKKAIIPLESAITYDRLQLRAYYRLARAHYELGDFQNALSTYGILQRYAPDYSQVHYNLAAVYCALQRWGEAQRELALAGQQGTLPPNMSLDEALARLREAREAASR